MLAYLQLIFLLATSGVFSVPLNQSILINTYGFSLTSTEINLSGKSIDKIDANTFIGFTKLEVLNLNDNKISSIDDALLKSLPNLREFWVESNFIITVDRNAFVGLTNLKKVCLWDNPVSTNFPTILTGICSTNPECELKISEKCEATVYPWDDRCRNTIDPIIKSTDVEFRLPYSPISCTDYFEYYYNNPTYAGYDCRTGGILGAIFNSGLCCNACESKKV
jgi:hypothetical protein